MRAQSKGDTERGGEGEREREVTQGTDGMKVKEKEAVQAKFVAGDTDYASFVAIYQI